MKIIVLVGMPGSGKSTYRKQLGLPYVCQDEMGSRDACANKAHEILKSGQDLVIDRTNIDKWQRAHWIKLAKYYKIDQIECVEFRSTPENCIKRIQSRENHETIPKETSLDKIRKIVLQFNKNYEEPKFNEGFSRIDIIYIDNFPSQDNKSV